MADVISRRSITYDIILNTKTAEKSAKDIGGAMDKAEKEVKKATTAVNDFAKKTLSAAAELRNIKAQLNNFSGNQKQFEALTLRAAQLTDQIEQTNQRIAVLASSTKNIQALTSAFSGLTGVFTAVQGAQAVFGRESQNVQAALVKLQGSLALLHGVQAAVATVTEQSAAKTVIMANAQKLYTFVVGTSTGALRAFKLALAGTGIGLFVVAIGVLISRFSDLTKSTKVQADALREHNKRVNDAVKGINELFASNREAAEGGIADYRRLIKVAEETGASEERIFQLKSALLQKELEELKLQEKEISELRGLSFAQEVLQLNKIAIAIKDKEAEIFVLRKKNIQDLAKLREKENNILFDPNERLSDYKDFTQKQKEILEQALDEINATLTERQDDLTIAPQLNLDQFNERWKELMRSRDDLATFGEVIKDNSRDISGSFAEIFGNLAALAKDGSNAQIAFSIANIFAANAEALAKSIAAASGVQWPANIPAILSSVATVTSMFASVNGVLAQARAAQASANSVSATAFASGEVDIHRPGEQRGKDSIPAIIMPGESVIRTDRTRQYKTELQAIQAGNLEEVIRVNYVEPALVMQALNGSKIDSTTVPDYTDKFYRQWLATGEGNVNSKRMLRVLASIDQKLTTKPSRYSR